MPTEDPVVDHIARQHAAMNTLRLEAHEKQCAERYANIASSLERLEEGSQERRASIKGIYGLLWSIAGFLFVLLIGAVGYLLDKQWPAPIGH